MKSLLSRPARMAAEALDRHPRMTLGGQWSLLVVLTVGGSVLLKQAGAPAALLLGPLMVGMIFGLSDARTRLPSAVRASGQAVIGCIIAVAIGGSVGPALLASAPLLVASGVAVLAMSMWLAALLAWARWFDGPTAVWGLAPGGAAAMVSLAEEFGANSQVTALMQYARILFAAGSAIIVSHLVSPAAPAHVDVDWFPAVDLRGVIDTIVLAAAGFLAARVTGFRPAVFLVPGLGGAALVAAGWMNPALPPTLVLPAYAVVGLSIGLSFTRPTLAACLRQLHRIGASVVLLIAVCAGVGAVVSLGFGVDPLTAYLATSPGGVDAILIVASSHHLDLSFVLAAQMSRLLLTLLAGPAITGFMARALRSRQPAE